MDSGLLIYTHPVKMRPVGPVSGTLAPPGSKSLTNRVFLLAALARGESEILRPLFSDDTLYMLSSLKYLGFRLSQSPDTASVKAQGADGSVPWDGARLYVGNAGTAMRFLAATLCLGRGSYTLDGDGRMRQRPMADLIEALETLGATVRTPAREGRPPLEISGGPVRGGEVEVDGSTSSQFLSALLMTGRCMEKGLIVRVKGELVSRPYVDLTLDAMQRFGCEAENRGYRSFRVPPGSYRGAAYEVEADATAASYFLAAAAVTGGDVTVQGLGTASRQGDVGFADVLAAMGCRVDKTASTLRVRGPALRGVDVDLCHMPDVVPTLAQVALCVEGPTVIRNVANLRVKESDRLSALTREIRKLGGSVDERPDGLTLRPGRPLHGADIDTYNDHRIAMSFAVLGLAVPGIVIRNPGCVSKTYPRFFEDLSSITASPPTL